jgi:hypothetical protein
MLKQVSLACMLAWAIFVLGQRASLSGLHSNSTGTQQSPVAELTLQCSGRDDTAAIRTALLDAKGGAIAIRSGQLCVAGDVTIPNLRIENGGLLKPITSHSIVLSNFSAGRYQVFANALAGQGKIVFSPAAPPILPEWWVANVAPGTTDMTAGVQAALIATGGRGKVKLTVSSYIITESLTIPAAVTSGNQTFGPVVIEGEGPFLSNLINRASSNKPTLLINRDLVTVRGVGFWGVNGFPNDGIKVSGAGRIHIENNEFFVNGNGIFLERSQSIWITNNYGAVSAGSDLPPAGAGAGWTMGSTASFIYADIPNGSGFAHHIVIRDNMNESYRYAVYMNVPSLTFQINWQITGNQFESSIDGGLKLDYLNNFEISGNYLGEGGGGYSINLNNCRDGRVGPNHLQTLDVTNTDVDQKISTIRVASGRGIVFMGGARRIYVTGSSGGLVVQGFLERLQDESSDHLISLVNVSNDLVNVPLGTMNSQTGRSVWYSDSTQIVAYPTARLGDRILKVTPESGQGIGWVCTKASSAGPLVQVTGSGPDPVVLNDYSNYQALDFRVTILTGGVTGKATYKVEWKPAGTGSYVPLTYSSSNVGRNGETSTLTTELAHLLNREGSSAGPVDALSIRWPTGQGYVSGDQWTLTAVTAPIWTAIPGR